MDCLIGIKGKNFVVMASDCKAARSILTMKKDLDKMFLLGKNIVMACGGEQGDAVQFSEYIAKNTALYRMKNGYDLSVRGAAGFTRRYISDTLRSRDAYHVNLILGGVDKDGSPSLYLMDYLGTSAEVPFAVHGYGSFFTLSVLDRYYTPDISKDQAIDLLKVCINEIAERFLINLESFKVKVIDSAGVHELPDLRAGSVRRPRPDPMQIAAD